MVKLGQQQSDQIGRIHAYRAILHFFMYFENCKNIPYSGLLSLHGKNYALILTKKWIGIHTYVYFGRNSSGHPGQPCVAKFVIVDFVVIGKHFKPKPVQTARTKKPH
jgi:hypothetical protein